MKFILYALAGFLSLALAARAQTTAFTYQGQLNNSNAPVTGLCDFRFQIYSAASVVAGPLTNAPVGVTNGLFTVTLDFGASVFDGSTRSLEIGVRGYGETNGYAVLAPRQPLTSVPYAIRAIIASNAVALTAPLPATNLTGTIPNSLLSSNVAILTNNVTFSGSVTAATFNGSFVGNGAGLTSVPGTSLTGTIPDARLSANVALQSGSSLNFAGSVAATNFTGAGHGLTNVPGAFFWVTVAGTSSPILPNVGYIANSDTTPVTLTLPSSPSVGDVYKVAGVGAGGWIIAQNANQSILTGNLSDSIGVSWTARSSSMAWSAVASSADGTKLVAVVKSGQIYTSTNSGSTWAPRESSRNWSSVASSADGTKLVATVGDNTTLKGNVYTSVDSGATWAEHIVSGLTRQWISCASSADGTKLVAVVYNGQIWTSTDSGANWTARDVARLWMCTASSSDGSKLVAAVNAGQIYTSINSGANWAAVTSFGSPPSFTSVCSTSDGSRLGAVASGGGIYISYDSGATWQANSTITGTWTSIASSAGGSRLVAVASSGGVYTSNDSGSTWVQRVGPPAASWTGAASSADGSKLVLVASGGQIYTSSQGSTTTGATGYLLGPQHSAIELLYVGNNLFLPLNHEGTIRAY